LILLNQKSLLLKIDVVIYLIKIRHKYKTKKPLPTESSFYKKVLVDYFFFKNSSTASGDIIDSTNVYAPVFGDFTILMAFDNLFEAVCKDATVFFAMIQVCI